MDVNFRTEENDKTASGFRDPDNRAYGGALVIQGALVPIRADLDGTLVAPTGTQVEVDERLQEQFYGPDAEYLGGRV